MKKQDYYKESGCANSVKGWVMILILFALLFFVFGCSYRVDKDITVIKNEYHFPKVEYAVVSSIWIFKGMEAIAPVHSNVWYCDPITLDSIKNVAEIDSKYWVGVGDSLIKIKQKQND